jgi:hypothetical protein
MSGQEVTDSALRHLIDWVGTNFNALMVTENNWLNNGNASVFFLDFACLLTGA